MCVDNFSKGEGYAHPGLEGSGQRGYWRGRGARNVRRYPDVATCDCNFCRPLHPHLVGTKSASMVALCDSHTSIRGKIVSERISSTLT